MNGGAVYVYDGADLVGSIIERDGVHFTFDAGGTLIGKYPTRLAASRAIPQINKRRST